MLPLEPLRAVRAVSMTSSRTEDTGTCTPPDVVASGWSRQTPSACRNAGRIQQVHGGEGQACSGPLDGGNAAPPMSVSTKTFVFIAGRYAALRALHRSMLKRVSLVAAPRREVHVYGFGDGTRSHEGLVREAAGPVSAALPVPPLRQSEPTSADSASPPGKARSCQYRPSRHFRRLMRAEGSFASRRCSGIMRYLT